ncbi:MAG: putative toxin-antitoxin system toxin component, PIN family [Bacillota bacterium]|nr:putative toxin-antitoxin system toxin component, PIN family [Bacillota bacterium]
MYRVVADTNVYISAILFGGKPEEIIKLALEEKIELIISGDILAEMAYILRSKFKWSNYQVNQLLAMLQETVMLVTPQQRLKVIKDDEKDNRVLECALEGKADYIISGDKRHLLPLKEFQTVRIVDPAGFFELYS